MAYNHQSIEKKWQKFWEENKTFSVENTSAFDSAQAPVKTFYALDMFPFPSGAGLHVGHPEGYTATDIICRKRRMEGYKVLHPMGWDAFGLPAENFAIKTGQQPEISTNANIKNFTRQIKSLGFSYDWNREFSTTDPDYYKWTQDLFLKFYEKGMLYEDEKPLNWCGACKVVCANEEVEQGLHERCGNAVTKKSLKQWMFKITDYAERLLQDLDKPNVVLIHGWEGTGESNWFPEIKNYLEENKIEVSSLDFPNTNTPDYNEWKVFFEKNITSKLQSNTIILGHSLGCGFLQKYLSEENIKIGEIVFVAPTVTDCGIPEIKNFFTEEFNYEKIKESADNIFIIAGGKDAYITTKEFKFLTKKLNAHLDLHNNLGHFCEEKSPEVLDFFKKTISSVLDWPEKIKAMQRNWIGKSEGVEVDFCLENTAEKIRIYTTRPDTLFGATYMVLAPENPLVEKITTDDKKEEINEYKKTISAKSEMDRTELNKDKTGVFTGAYAINPITKENIPIWIADYILMGYGTGAIMAVPAHDERDFEFAQKYNLPIRRTIVSNRDNYNKIFDKHCEKIREEKGDLSEKDIERVEWITETLPYIGRKGELEGIYVSNEEICRTQDHTFFPEENDEEQYKRLCKMVGKSVPEVIEMMIQYLEDFNIGTRQTNFRLRDWIFTRQRYWGEPIPLVFDEAEKCYPLDSSELPLLLPETDNYLPSNSGESPLAKITDWVNVKGYITEERTVKIINPLNPPCQGEVVQNFRRETSVMPNWAGSSWYYLRYMDSKNSNEAWSKEAENQWGPVDLYVGGAEHAVLHLLYARFWHKMLYDMGMVSNKEPFKKLVNQGLILSYAYERDTGGLVPVDEVEEINGKYYYTPSENSETDTVAESIEVKKITAKMSKSLKNVVNPDEILEAFGADTLRMYEMFMGPFEQNKAWDTSAVEGMYKFLSRIHRYFTEKEISDSCPSPELIKLTHQTVKKVSHDIDEFKFNTAISQMMVWMNAFQKLDTVPRIAGGKFVRLLAPFAPHLAEELWKSFDFTQEPNRSSSGVEMQTITFVPWPSYDEKLLVESSVKYAVQVNGKLRGDFEISKDATQEECIAEAKKIDKVMNNINLLGGEEKVRKEIFVKGKIVGFVVK